MIEPKEVQLGNLVLYQGEIVEIAQIDSKQVCITGPKGALSVNPIRIGGVELTPELLERLGFVEFEKPNVLGSLFYWVDRGVLTHEIYHHILQNKFVWAGKKSKEVKFIHEVQNGFFFFENKQLTLAPIVVNINQVNGTE